MDSENLSSSDEFVTPVKFKTNSYKSRKKYHTVSRGKHKASMENKRNHNHGCETISESSISSDEEIKQVPQLNSQKFKPWISSSTNSSMKTSSNRSNSDKHKGASITSADHKHPSVSQLEDEGDKSDASTLDLFGDDTVPESDIVSVSDEADVKVSDSEEDLDCGSLSFKKNKSISHVPAQSQKSHGMPWLSAKLKSSQNPRFSQKNALSSSSNESDSDSQQTIFQSQSTTPSKVWRKTSGNIQSKDAKDISDVDPRTLLHRRQDKAQNMFKSLQKNKSLLESLIDPAKGLKSSQTSQEGGKHVKHVSSCSEEFKSLHSSDASFEDSSPTFGKKRTSRLSLKRKRDSTNKKEATEANSSQKSFTEIDSDSDIIMSGEDTQPLSNLDSTVVYPVTPETIKVIGKDSTISYPVTPKRMELISLKQKQKQKVPSSLHSSGSSPSAPNFPFLCKSSSICNTSQEVPLQGKINTSRTDSTAVLSKRSSNVSLTSMPSLQKKPSNISDDGLSEDNLSMPVLTQYPISHNSEPDSDSTVEWSPPLSRMSQESVPRRLQFNSHSEMHKSAEEEKTDFTFCYNEKTASPPKAQPVEASVNSPMFSQSSSHISGISQDVVKIISNLTEGEKSPVNQVHAAGSQKFSNSASENLECTDCGDDNGYEDKRGNKLYPSNIHNCSDLPVPNHTVSVTASSDNVGNQVLIKKEVDNEDVSGQETSVNYSLMDDEVYVFGSDDEKLYMSQCILDDSDEQKKNMDGAFQVKTETSWWDDENDNLDQGDLQDDKKSKTSDPGSRMNEIMIDLSDIPDSDDEIYLMEASQAIEETTDDIFCKQPVGENLVHKEDAESDDIDENQSIQPLTQREKADQDNDSYAIFASETQIDFIDEDIVFLAPSKVNYTFTDSEEKLPDIEMDANQSYGRGECIESSSMISQFESAYKVKPKETFSIERQTANSEDRAKIINDLYELDTDIDSPSAVGIIDEYLYDQDTELDEDSSVGKCDKGVVLDRELGENDTSVYSCETLIDSQTSREEGHNEELSQQEGNQETCLQNQEDHENVYLQQTLIDSPPSEEEHDEVADNDVFDWATQIDMDIHHEGDDSQDLIDEAETELDSLEDERKSPKLNSNGVTKHNIVEYMAATQVDQMVSTDKKGKIPSGKIIQLIPKPSKNQIQRSEENVFGKLTTEFKPSTELSSTSLVASATGLSSRGDPRPRQTKQSSSLEKDEEGVDTHGYISDGDGGKGNHEEGSQNYQTDITVKEVDNVHQEDHDNVYLQQTLIDSPPREEEHDEVTDNDVFDCATQIDMDIHHEGDDSQDLIDEAETEHDSLEDKRKSPKLNSHGVNENNIVEYMAATQVDQMVSADKKGKIPLGKIIQLIPKPSKNQIQRSEENVFEKLTTEFKSSTELSSTSLVASATGLSSRGDPRPRQTKQSSSLEKDEEGVDTDGYISDGDGCKGNHEEGSQNYQTDITVKEVDNVPQDGLVDRDNPLIVNQPAAEYPDKEITGPKCLEGVEESVIRTTNLKKKRTLSSSSSEQGEIPFDFFSMQTLVDDASCYDANSESDTEKDAYSCDIDNEKHKSDSDDAHSPNKNTGNESGKTRAKESFDYNSEDSDKTVEYDKDFDKTVEYDDQDINLTPSFCDGMPDVKSTSQCKVSYQISNANIPNRTVNSECDKGKDLQTKAKESFDHNSEDPDQTLEYGHQEIHPSRINSDTSSNFASSDLPRDSHQATAGNNLPPAKMPDVLGGISNNDTLANIVVNNTSKKNIHSDPTMPPVLGKGVVRSGQVEQAKTSGSTPLVNSKNLPSDNRKIAQPQQKVLNKRAVMAVPDSKTEEKKKILNKKICLGQNFWPPDSSERKKSTSSSKPESDKNKSSTSEVAKTKGWISANKGRAAVKRPTGMKAPNTSHSKPKKPRHKSSGGQDRLLSGIEAARQRLQSRLKKQTNTPVVRDRRHTMSHSKSNDDDVEMPCTQDMMAQGLPILEKHYLVDKSRLSHTNTAADHCNRPVASDSKIIHAAATQKAPLNMAVVKDSDTRAGNADAINHLNDKISFKGPPTVLLSKTETAPFHSATSTVPSTPTIQAHPSEKTVSISKLASVNSRASDSKKCYQSSSKDQPVPQMSKSETRHLKPSSLTTSARPLKSVEAFDKGTPLSDQNALLHTLPATSPVSSSSSSHHTVLNRTQQSSQGSRNLKQTEALPSSITPSVQAQNKALPLSEQNAIIKTTATNLVFPQSALKFGILKQNKPLSAPSPQVRRVKFDEARNESRQIEPNNQTKNHPINRPSSVISNFSQRARSITLTEAKLDFLSQVLKWNPDWLDTQALSSKPPPLIDQDKLQRLRMYYTSFKEYFEITSSLLVLEVWETIFQDWKLNKSPNKFKILNCKMPQAPDDEHKKRGLLRTEFIGIVARGDTWKLPAIGSLLIMDCWGQSKWEKTQSQPNWFQQFACVKHIRTDPMGMTFFQQYPMFEPFRSEVLKRDKRPLVFTLTVDILFRGNFSKKLFVTREISSLKTSFRQLEALANLPQNELCLQLLDPSLPEVFYHKLVKPGSDLVSKLNQEQAVAVATICKSVQGPKNDRKVFLLQGPPGTGKSHTILNLIHNVLVSSGFRVSVCLATPSNAAVDEMARRIIRFSHKLKSQGLQSISLVRLGNIKSVHQDVQPYFLDQLVQERHRKNCLQNAPGSVREEYNMYEAQEAEIQKLLNSKSLQRAQTAGKKAEISEIQKKMNSIRAEMVSKKVSPRQQWEGQCHILDNAHVVCGTLSSFGAANVKYLLSQGDNRRHQGSPFSLMIIDEATQATEVDCLIPLQYKTTKVVLVGDQKQLPATVKSKKAIEKQLNRSLFERLFDRLHLRSQEASKNDPSFVSPIMTLVKQYRMHSEILSLPNTFFYEDKLKTDASVNARKSALAPYLVFDIREGKESTVDGRSNGSIANQAEAACTAQLCLVVMETLKEKYDTIHKKIGVICPYADQKNAIMSHLKKSRLEKIEVNTVDGFQGQEKEVIIMSCVRAQSTTIGFVADMKRMNVALTRARQALYVLGHFETLRTDELWHELYKNASDRNLMVPVSRTSDFHKLARKTVNKYYS